MVIGGNVKNVIVSGKIETSTSTMAGGIVGAIKDGTIENCINKANISGIEYSGGINGYLLNSSIKSCRNESSYIKSTGSMTYYWDNAVWNASGNVGGIVGYLLVTLQ